MSVCVCVSVCVYVCCVCVCPTKFAILIKNFSFRSYDTFAYLLRAHIRNINMRRYINSARGHELSGRVRVHTYNYYVRAECVWVAK